MQHPRCRHQALPRDATPQMQTPSSPPRCNTPDADTKLSPAMQHPRCRHQALPRDVCASVDPSETLFPSSPRGRYKPHITWRETLVARENALRNRHMKAMEHWSEHTRQLPPLVVGDRVRIQNQTGPHPTKWDKTGQVIEVRQFDQYIVRMDGSRRVTLRNRKFLRKYIPVYQPNTWRITYGIRYIHMYLLPFPISQMTRLGTQNCTTPSTTTGHNMPRPQPV